MNTQNAATIRCIAVATLLAAAAGSALGQQWKPTHPINPSPTRRGSRKRTASSTGRTMILRGIREGLG